MNWAVHRTAVARRSRCRVVAYERKATVTCIWLSEIPGYRIRSKAACDIQYLSRVWAYLANQVFSTLNSGCPIENAKNAYSASFEPAGQAQSLAMSGADFVPETIRKKGDQRAASGFDFQRGCVFVRPKSQ